MKTIEKVDDPLTVTQVAEDLEMHPHTVRRLIRTKKLRAYKRSGGRIDKKSWLIDPVDPVSYTHLTLPTTPYV